MLQLVFIGCTRNMRRSIPLLTFPLSVALMQGFALERLEERDAVLGCLTVFLDALEAVTSAQGRFRAQTKDETRTGLQAESSEGQHSLPGAG